MSGRRDLADMEESRHEDPTDEERWAIEQAWYRGEPLPPGWVMVELPAGLKTPSGWTIPPQTFVLLRENYVAAIYAGQVGNDS